MLQIDEALRLRLASWDARPKAERSVRMLWPVEGDGWVDWSELATPVAGFGKALSTAIGRLLGI
jgi:hypothetical protein